MMLSLALLLALAALPAPARCAAGQSIGPDTAGHCCWGNQAWSKTRNRCLGVPACPEGLVVLGEECGCPTGQSVSEDTNGHCCWAGQAWSSARAVCVGVPTCPVMLVQSAETCVPPMSIAGPEVVPDAPPPMVQVELDCPSGLVRNQGLCCAPGQNVVEGRCAEPPRCQPDFDAVGEQCVARVAPQPVQPVQPVQPTRQPLASSPEPVAPEPVVAQRTPPPTEKDRYQSLDRVFVSVSGAFDFSEFIYGGQAVLDLIFVRGRAASFGLSLGVGAMSSTSEKLVVYLPSYLQLGIRLGPSLSEFVLRTGAAAAFVSKYGSSEWMGKFVVGAGFAVRWSNGGVIFGVDLYINAKIAHAITVGFIF